METPALKYINSSLQLTCRQDGTMHRNVITSIKPMTPDPLPAQAFPREVGMGKRVFVRQLLTQTVVCGWKPQVTGIGRLIQAAVTTGGGSSAWLQTVGMPGIATRIQRRQTAYPTQGTALSSTVTYPRPSRPVNRERSRRRRFRRRASQGPGSRPRPGEKAAAGARLIQAPDTGARGWRSCH